MGSDGERGSDPEITAIERAAEVTDQSPAYSGSPRSPAPADQWAEITPPEADEVLDWAEAAAPAQDILLNAPVVGLDSRVEADDGHSRVDFTLGPPRARARPSPSLEDLLDGLDLGASPRPSGFLDPAERWGGPLVPGASAVRISSPMEELLMGEDARADAPPSSPEPDAEGPTSWAEPVVSPPRAPQRDAFVTPDPPSARSRALADPGDWLGLRAKPSARSAAGDSMDWVEAEELERVRPAPDRMDTRPPPPDVFSGDGPFAAPMDRPIVSDRAVRSGGANPIVDAIATTNRLPSRFAQPPVPAKRPVEAGVLGVPHVIVRRPIKKPPTDPPSRPATSRFGATERRYPKMRALLADADAIPSGSEPIPAPRPPPVPGTFFPAPRDPGPRPTPADLDSLLATMAEGLLIGENAAGQTEVRVTLKDEFFAGTELRIAVGGGEVSAELHPPDREIYWQLQGNLEELRERLSSRGLRVTNIRVLDP